MLLSFDLFLLNLNQLILRRPMMVDLLLDLLLLSLEFHVSGCRFPFHYGLSIPGRPLVGCGLGTVTISVLTCSVTAFLTAIYSESRILFRLATAISEYPQASDGERSCSHWARLHFFLGFIRSVASYASSVSAITHTFCFYRYVFIFCFVASLFGV